MDDGFNLFIFCRVSQRLTSQHFGISGNMVNVRYYFLIFFCCLLQAEAATLWVMRSHYTMITEVWFQALFPALSCQTYPSILWKEIWMVNIYPLSYFGEHYPHLCDACFSSELKVYSVFLTSPAQQICLQSILISVPDCRRRLCVCGWTCVCVHFLSPVISNHHCRCVSVMMMPTMWVTGSVSRMAKVKWGSSNVIGSAEGGGRVIHSMSSLDVDEREGLPWSVALIWKLT